MSVAELLKTKGNAVYSVNENASLREAILLLNSRNIGVVIVTDSEGMLCGILSERDIVRKSLAQETGFRDEAVNKTMTQKVLSVAPSASIDEVMNIMTTSRIRHIPVLEDGSILGLVSIGDIVKRKILEAESESAALREYISAG